MSFIFGLLYFGLFFSDPLLLCAIVPIKTYFNAEDDKAQILSENKNKSGIYMWKNQKNGKCYIGSSENLRSRFLQYFNTNHLLTYIYMNICKALLKHGYSNFELIILEYCEPSKCLEREGFYQKKFNPEYNIAQDPTAPMSGRKHSDDSKKIMSDAKKIDNPGRYKTGHEHSDETKTKISEAHKGKTLSNETKTKISDTKKGQPKV